MSLEPRHELPAGYACVISLQALEQTAVHYKLVSALEARECWLRRPRRNCLSAYEPMSLRGYAPSVLVHSS